MTDTEHSTTSSLNEEDVALCVLLKRACSYRECLNWMRSEAKRRKATQTK